MKRRKIIQSTIMTSAIPVTYLMRSEKEKMQITEKELYEIRRYEMKVKPEYANSLSNLRKVFLTPF